MIAVRDLQIGDFINTVNNGVVQITVLSWKGVGYEGGASTPEHCSYIPLTEDILVKNGFHRSQRWHYCEFTTEDGFKIYVQLGCGGTIEYVRITKHNSDLMERDLDVTVSIHYVHQLQHLLRLCGIEKELTI